MPADGQPRLAPAGERSRVSSAICSVPSVGFRDLHATKRHLGVASPEGASRVESSGPGMADSPGTVAPAYRTGTGSRGGTRKWWPSVVASTSGFKMDPP
jgi:hypothetical protein